MEKVTLFYLENSDIKISMRLYFNEKDQLYFDGYDTGKSVQETSGTSGYEYSYTIEYEESNKFYQIFNLKNGDKSALLQVLKKEFSINEAFTLFGEFMQVHNIKYKRFLWTS